MEPIRSHDALFKFVFREPEQMAELLRTHLEPAVCDVIAWATLALVPGSFVDEALRERHTDLLFTVAMNGAPALLYVIAEHKSSDDRFTAWQIAGYVVRIVERWRIEHPDADHVPPVLPFVVYHGERPWRAPRSPRDLVDLSHLPPEAARSLAVRQLHVDYSLLDLSGIDEAWLDGRPLSPVTATTLRFLQFLRAVSLEQALASFRRWRPLLTRLQQQPRGEEVLAALFTWYLAGVPDTAGSRRTVMTKIQAENPPMRSLLDALLELGEARGMEKGVQQGLEKGVRQGIEEGVQLGLEQGLEQGREQGMRTVLTELLESRFGPLSPGDVARIAGADAGQLRRWSTRVLTAASSSEVFAAEG